ncbi:a-factor receptor [Marasmius crinis-equi]|uniref:A-factor receptor n=1 Tax=Marasmius crinis-equi TaxID=585013 RepID=A0ABR3FIX0_9AGAR
MTLAFVDILCSLPLGAYVVYIGSHGLRLRPWISWADTHYDFGRIEQVPSLIWRNDPSAKISTELDRWIGVFCAFSFFALFGFANEAQKNYRLAFWYVARKFGYQQPQNKAPKLPNPKYQPMSGDSLPLYRVSDGKVGKAHKTDSALFKGTVCLTSSFENSSTVLCSPTTPPTSPPSYEWPSTPNSLHDGKHLSLMTNGSTECRNSMSSTPLSSPTSTVLEHGDLAARSSYSSPGATDVPRPEPVHLPHSRTESDTPPNQPPLPPPFSPVAPYHRPLSPDIYPRSQPFGGF